MSDNHVSHFPCLLHIKYPLQVLKDMELHRQKIQEAKGKLQRRMD